jgi:ribosomal protein S18 acetylase RimI-like enzyme
MSIEIREANFERAAEAAGFLAVLESYARGATGGGTPLDQDVKRRLVPALREQPGALVLLAFSDGEVVGIASCFFGFSTFAARPLLNVHDLAVLPEFQGRGIGGALLAAAEERAVARGCCKVTLEVLETNAGARRLYQQRGFRDFELAGVAQRTLFLVKPLPRAD